MRQTIRAVLLLAVLLVGVPGAAAAASSPPVVSSRPAAVSFAARPVEIRAADGATRGRWAWPVAAPHPLLRGFVAPATAYSAGHRGIDVGAAVGSPVRAPADGQVVYAGRIADRGVLSIDHGGVVSSFEPVLAAVRTGETVARGQRVAVVGEGGHAPGTLHIGARLHGAYVSPLLFLGGAVHAVLLPVSGR